MSPMEHDLRTSTLLSQTMMQNQNPQILCLEDAQIILKVPTACISMSTVPRMNHTTSSTLRGPGWWTRGDFSVHSGTRSGEKFTGTQDLSLLELDNSKLKYGFLGFFKGIFVKHRIYFIKQFVSLVYKYLDTRNVGLHAHLSQKLTVALALRYAIL